MRRTVWVWVVVAFLAGLLPGGAVSAYLWRTNRASRAVLLDRNSQLRADNQALQTRVNSAEASVSVLDRKLEQLNAQTNLTPLPTAGSGTGAAPVGPPNIIARSVSPAQVAPGGEITLTVKLRGHADIAKMRIAGGSFDKIYDLARESYDSSGEVWQKEIKAPSAAGTYKFYALAYDAAKKKYTMPGTSGFSFEVK